MSTTYVRLKNRRGNKSDLPTPLAEGELGLALDTRELYIGGGNQDAKNRMVQISNYLNAQSDTQSRIDNRLVFFKLAETENVVGNGTQANLSVLKGSQMTLPSSKASPYNPESFVITKFNINQIPATIQSNNYTVSTSGSNLNVITVAGAIPENNTVVVVSKWTVAEIVSAIGTALPGLDVTQTSTTNQLYIDLTTGTGFVDVGASGNQTTTASTLTNLDMISTAFKNADNNIRGNISNLPYAAGKIITDGNLLIESDSPTSALNLATFLNRATGSNYATVANNIQVFTQDSRPIFENNIFVKPSSLNQKTLTAGGVTADVITFDTTKSNSYFIDYSLKFGSALAAGTMRIITDGSTAELLDDRTETAATSNVVFSADLSGATLRLRYNNSHGSTNATLSYVLKHWLTA
tara:strand:- start:1111 stop:2337 length:1227 start_codon:yes stop_codon:yes gene_type:complete